jgi:YHS domain-containing protein
MPEKFRPLLVAATLLLSATGSLAQPEPTFGTFKVDVVSLISEGKTEPGKSEYAADRLGYRYLFSTKAHRDAFQRSPAAYEVQLGGACGKMAELGGRGSTERYWVYKGKLFVFASDGCRTGFQQNPEGHIEVDDAKPTGTKAQADRGRKLIDLAAKWSGIDQLGKAGTISTIQESVLKQGSQTYDVRQTTLVGAKGDYFDLETYNGSGYGNRIENGKAFEIDPKGNIVEHVPTWKRAVERRRSRMLAHLLLSRRSRSFLAFEVGNAKGVSEVAVHVDGVASTLKIEEQTGKVLAQTVTGRNRFGILGPVEMTFSAYDTKEGVTYPVAWTARYGGQDSPIHGRQGMKLEVVLK